jgi:hypothetical protein
MNELEIKRSAVRRWVTYMATLTLFSTLLGIAGWAAYYDDLETIKWIVPLTIAAASPIIGFWFGERKKPAE